MKDMAKHGISMSDATVALGNPCPVGDRDAEKETPNVTGIRQVGCHLQDRCDGAVPAPRGRSTRDLHSHAATAAPFDATSRSDSRTADRS
jgi:hypothetical protein